MEAVLRVEARKRLMVIMATWVLLLVQVFLARASTKLVTTLVAQLLDHILPTSLTKPTQELIAISLSLKDITMDVMPPLPAD